MLPIALVLLALLLLPRRRRPDPRAVRFARIAMSRRPPSE